jgi:hypothetical protein
MSFNETEKIKNNQILEVNELEKSIKSLSLTQKLQLVKEISQDMSYYSNQGKQIFVHANTVIQVNTETSSLDAIFLKASNLIGKKIKKTEC